MKKLISWLLMILIWFIDYLFAFEINLNVDRNTININNPLKLKLSIKNDKNSSVSIQKIKWLNNFDIIGQNQFQSMSSEIKIINWKQKTKTIINQTLLLILQAKKTWTYTIWPAIIKVWDKIYKSNTIKIKITWSKIMIWNSSLNIPTQINQTENKQFQIWTNKENKKEKQIISFYKIALYLGLLSIIWWVLLVYALKSKEEEKILQQDEDKKSNIENTTKNIKQTISPLSFLEKYWIKNPETKTYSELMQEIKTNNINLTDEEKQIIEDELIGKFKN